MEETLPMRLIDRIAEDIAKAWHENNIEEASTKSEALISMCPSRSDYWMSAACARWRANNVEGTLEAIAHAIKRCPDDRHAIATWANQVSALVPLAEAARVLESASSAFEGEHAPQLARMLSALAALAR